MLFGANFEEIETNVSVPGKDGGKNEFKHNKIGKSG